MNKIYFLGECMVELRASTPGIMHQSFAGDVYNSAVYLKRCFNAIDTSMVTAVGKDTLSTAMVSQFKDEGLNTDLVFVHPTKAPGMYLIETDDEGERSFTYWRSDAAARKVVDFLSDESLAALDTGDMFFVSGISLAVIEPESRDAFWARLETLKAKGVVVVFDPNYRPRLWKDESEAKTTFEKAFHYCDLAMPGVEDLEVLYGVSDAKGVIEFCNRFNIDEVVVKNGPASVITSLNGSVESHTITPVKNVVDTTSAGDAFNGAYLGSRLSGMPIDKAVKLAAHAAGTVIQHPGAIAPKIAFSEAMADIAG